MLTRNRTCTLAHPIDPSELCLCMREALLIDLYGGPVQNIRFSIKSMKHMKNLYALNISLQY